MSAVDSLGQWRSIYGDLPRYKEEHVWGLSFVVNVSDDDSIWNALMASSEWVDRYCDRHFYPRVETRYVDVEAATQRLLVPDLISITSLKDDENQDGTFENTWAATDYHLLPYHAQPTARWGQPYDEVVVSRLSGSNKEFFPPGQRVIEIAGLWGYWQVKERSGDTLSGTLDASGESETITLTTGLTDNFAVGQTIQIDDEQFLVTAITGGVSLVGQRGLDVPGWNGTTPATHANAAVIYILRWPPAVELACMIHAARLRQRAPNFEPFFVDSNLDTDEFMLLEPYRRKAV